MNINSLISSPLFLLGCACKIFLILFYSPEIQQEWFLQFIQHTSEHPSFDPWTSYFQEYSSSEYLYGWAMLAPQIFFWSIGQFFDETFGINFFAEIFFKVLLFVADLCILYCLVILSQGRHKLILFFYWVSPLSIYITYIYGHIDIIPIMYLTLSLLLLKQYLPLASGFFIGLAISAKMSFLLILPLFIIFFINNKNFFHLLFKFFIACLITITVIVAPYIISGDFLSTLTQNQEANNLLSLSIEFDKGSIYLLPFVYILITFWLWNIRRINFNLFVVFISLALLVVIGLSDAPINWFLWILPFVALSQLQLSSRANFLLVLIFSLVILNHILDSYIDTNVLLLQSLFNSAVIAGLIISMLKIFETNIQNNDAYKISKKSVLIGVQGRSTNESNLINQSVSSVFHNALTKLITEDSFAISDNTKIKDSSIYAYDLDRLYKEINLFVTKQKFKTVDTFIISGKRILSHEVITKHLIASVAIKDIDMNFLDIKKHITSNSSLISVYCENSLSNSPVLNAKVTFEYDIYTHSLIRQLVGLCNLSLNYEIIENMAILSIDGELFKEDAELLIYNLFPNIDDIINKNTQWGNGILALIQILIIVKAKCSIA